MAVTATNLPTLIGPLAQGIFVRTPDQSKMETKVSRIAENGCSGFMKGGPSFMLQLAIGENNRIDPRVRQCHKGCKA